MNQLSFVIFALPVIFVQMVIGGQQRTAECSSAFNGVDSSCTSQLDNHDNSVCSADRSCIPELDLVVYTCTGAVSLGSYNPYM